MGRRCGVPVTDRLLRRTSVRLLLGLFPRALLTVPLGCTPQLVLEIQSDNTNEQPPRGADGGPSADSAPWEGRRSTPVITEVVSSKALVGAIDAVLTVRGTGFHSGATFRWDDLVLPTTLEGDHLRVGPLTLPNEAKVHRVFVTNPDASEAAGNLTVYNPVPVLTSVTASDARPGARNVTVRLQGQGLRPGATASFLGVPYTLNDEGGGFSFGPVALPDAAQVMDIPVSNRAPSLGATTARLRVPWPAAQVSKAELSRNVTGSKDVTLEIEGANFAPGVTITLPTDFEPVGALTPSTRTETKLTFKGLTLPWGLGDYKAVVRNPEPAAGEPVDVALPLLDWIRSCHQKGYIEPPDGIYALGARHSTALPVYCDTSTDGGGWLLVSKFSQHRDTLAFPQDKYDAYFKNALWNDGNADGRPLSPQGFYDTYHVESLRWRDHLVQGNHYRLRQTLRSQEGTSTVTPLDVSFAFAYNGYTNQNAVPVAQAAEDRAWALFDRRDYGSSPLNPSGPWDLQSREPVRFWLPFVAGFQGPLYHACNGFAFDLMQGACDHRVAVQRRYGSAGIMGASADLSDPAASWLPHMNAQGSGGTLAYAHQSPSYAGPTTGLYWIKELIPTVEQVEMSSTVAGASDVTILVRGEHFGASPTLKIFSETTSGDFVAKEYLLSSSPFGYQAQNITLPTGAGPHSLHVALAGNTLFSDAYDFTVCGPGQTNARGGSAQGTCVAASLGTPAKCDAGYTDSNGAAAGGRCIPLPSYPAQGGEVSDVVADGKTYRIHTYRGSGTFEAPSALVADVLVVAGGGGGGSVNGGGGGGGGGVVFRPGQALPSGSMAVVVGAGGTAATPTSLAGNGEDSAFGNFVAYGGGGGGSPSSTATDRWGRPGGSGGGVSRDAKFAPGGWSLQGLNFGSYGHRGGASVTEAVWHSAAGGGGAVQDGAPGTVGDQVPGASGGGKGGDGLALNLKGSTETFGGGGGGASHAKAGGVGGLGGGGRGAQAFQGGPPGPGLEAMPGVPNTGGGGGGGWVDPDINPPRSLPAGAGGSGIVMVRYSLLLACDAGYKDSNGAGAGGECVPGP